MEYFFFQRPNSRKSKNLDPLCANQKLDPAKKIGLIRNPGIQVTERNHTVDGRNPVPVDVENMPFFHRVLYRYITGGAGFLPATVSCKMSLGCEMPLKKNPRFMKSSSLERVMAMWWFETFFIFTLPAEMIQFDEQDRFFKWVVETPTNYGWGISEKPHRFRPFVRDTH